MTRSFTALSLLLISLTACAGGKHATNTAEKAMPTNDDTSNSHHKHHELGPESHDGNGPLVHRFTDPEKYAKMWESDERAQWQQPEMLIDAMDIQPGDTVADIGTGTGFFLPYLSEAVGPEGTVLALDIEPSMITYVGERIEAEGLSNVEAHVVGMADPNLPINGVDAILIVNTWHHIPDRNAYAQTLKKGLTEDGGLFVIDFSQDSELGPKKHHRLSPIEVIQELQDAGMDARIMEVGLREQYIVRGGLPAAE